MREKTTIEERAVEIAQYIICSKDTVRGAAKKFGISKSTVHTVVTLKNGRKNGQVIPESIEIKKVFLAEKNPVVKLGLVIK
jgi:putative DeoR family transcriptional regulator (stage III sporulation protein D)